MCNKTKTLAVGIVAFTGMIGVATQAMAACTPSLTSDGSYNTCIGTGALEYNSGSSNTGVGQYALAENTGDKNTAVGIWALSRNTGDFNTASGYEALSSNKSANYNTASGYYTLYSNTTGQANTATGAGALVSNTKGGNNTALGASAGYKQTTGSNNTALGYQAGYNHTTGSYNIAIAAPGVAAETKTIRIGVQGTQTKTIIAGIRGVTVTSGSAVLVNSLGQLGVASSSRRYKEDIQPMGDVSDRLMDLRPVTFRYKEADEDGNKPVQYGLIAEEVDTAMPELVVRNDDGSPETVAYHVLPSLLLNEYQKQHQELAETKEKLTVTEEKRAAAEVKLSTTEEKIVAMQAEMSRMNDSMDRLMAALAPTTKLASAE
jgi:hypothetical protein